ncbi:hypothetical protein GOP47_0015378 [Adiantum capillus-veneris]|uniref:glucose-6-phosphate dehydrogenase (NADP(+)) n=1 Tax=Adiantum capillus-veneris TaxID=13818 RepID=A0A9D4UJW9_ADICA|nr:hypothetical protein GOP47_0015378 [Adiantum capillus-veneris]
MDELIPSTFFLLGVPFKLKVVRSSNNQKEEIRVQFKDVPNDIYEGQKEGQNELIVSLKPSAAAMKLKLTHKKMGKQRALDFSYEEGQEDVDVYARLLLFMIRGDQSHFIREDEVRAARKIFSPLLHVSDAFSLGKLN